MNGKHLTIKNPQQKLYNCSYNLVFDYNNNCDGQVDVARRRLHHHHHQLEKSLKYLAI
jgi:hypothetical protein